VPLYTVPPYFFEFHLNNILVSTPCYLTWVLLQVSATTISFPYALLFSPTQNSATCSAHLVLFDVVTLIVVVPVLFEEYRSRCRTGIARSVRAKRPRSSFSTFGMDSRFFPFPHYPYRLRNPSSFLSNRFRGCLRNEWSGRFVKLTTQLHLVPKTGKAWNYVSTPSMRLHGFTFCKIINLVTMQFFQRLVSIFESKQGHVATWSLNIRWLTVFHVFCHPYFVRRFIHYPMSSVSSELGAGRARKFIVALGTETS
jgi:hypothetical protein